ncbi:hypothetical protein D7W79_02420 [Corallococcus exercitus]|nr:hypothetical protein [Corallococcus exercitus]RKG82534.1 hypothetical protein D7W79_02420 [Corallococcus exercitus]
MFVPNLWLDDVASFTPHSSLTPDRREEIRKLRDQANLHVSTYIARNRSDAQRSQYAEWIAFGLSSLITLLAGYFGQLPEPAAAPSAPDPASQATGGAQTARSPTRGARAVSRSRFAVMVGVVGALAAISTGFSNRFQVAAAKSLVEAKIISEALEKTMKIAAAPTSEADLEEALQSLQQTLLLNAP